MGMCSRNSVILRTNRSIIDTPSPASSQLMYCLNSKDDARIARNLRASLVQRWDRLADEEGDVETSANLKVVVRSDLLLIFDLSLNFVARMMKIVMEHFAVYVESMECTCHNIWYIQVFWVFSIPCHKAEP